MQRAAVQSRAWSAYRCVALLALLVGHSAAGQAQGSVDALEKARNTGPSCSPFNLMRSALVSGPDLLGNLQVVKDGEAAEEGTVSQNPMAVRFGKPAAELSVDLGYVQRLGYLVIQADANDAYSIEGSLDAVAYRGIWTAGPSSDHAGGLRTRSVALPTAVDARYLRIKGTAGDGRYAISELAAYCSAPTPWPPRLLERPGILTWRWIDQDIMVQIKGYAAAFSALVLLGWVLSRRLRRSVRIACDVLLGVCGLVAFASWWNLGHFHFDEYVHNWEHYHYYIGAKYAPELRYTRLYECTAAADLSDGLRTRVAERTMRDLSLTNELGSTRAILTDPGLCTRHFSPERWHDFRQDIRFFRGRFAPARWSATQTDHGYNGTPVWAILARVITQSSDLSAETIEHIAHIDSALLVLMWVTALWAFGWRATCVALLWWGFNVPAMFSWNGGAFLRYDWLCTMLIGIGLLKKRYHFAAGLTLTYSTLLRIFPGFILAALLLKAVAQMVGARRIFVSRSHAAFAAGCITAAAVLLPASGWATGGFDAWPRFFENSQKHLHTALLNNMGLKTVLEYDTGTAARLMQRPSEPDPLREWKSARAHFHHEREPILFVLLGLFCVMLARAGQREPDWVVACLGTGLITFATELTCYYYGFLLAYGLLWNRYRFPGIAATVLASLTCLFSFLLKWHDDLFAAISLATTLVVVGTTAAIAFHSESPARSPTQVR